MMLINHNKTPANEKQLNELALKQQILPDGEHGWGVVGGGLAGFFSSSGDAGGSGSF